MSVANLLDQSGLKWQIESILSPRTIEYLLLLHETKDVTLQSWVNNSGKSKFLFNFLLLYCIIFRKSIVPHCLKQAIACGSSENNWKKNKHFEIHSSDQKDMGKTGYVRPLLYAF